MSAPISPGALSSPSATGSVTTAISRAFFACAAAASSDRSATRPRISGYWTTTHEVSSSIRSISAAVSGSGERLGASYASASPVNLAIVCATET
jgi:hypothetical protein